MWSSHPAMSIPQMKIEAARRGDFPMLSFRQFIGASSKADPSLLNLTPEVWEELRPSNGSSDDQEGRGKTEPLTLPAAASCMLSIPIRRRKHHRPELGIWSVKLEGYGKEFG